MINNKKADRVIKLYEFLKEYQRIKSPIVTELEQQEWVKQVDESLKVDKGEDLFIIEKQTEEDLLFDTFYSLYARLKKEPESIELIYGDIHLEQGELSHPILLQPISIEFDAARQCFRVILADKLPELYQMFLGLVQGISEDMLIDIIRDFKEKPISPLDEGETIAFIEKMKEGLTEEGIKIVRQPVLFLRRRQQGFGMAIDAIIEDILKGKEIPPFIADIVGLGDVARKGQKSKEALKKLTIDVNGIDQKVLFTKPANKEQLLVAKHLERNEAVLVQGPPGTGKTHTIANMLGHFLAEGKSVLVTSYSEKALAVVKNQVTKDLQSLCVSVLGDAESRKELEKSLELIQGKRASLERSELTRRVAMNEKNREACLRTLDKLKSELKAIKLNEYTPFKVAGKMYKPVEAAKYVNAHEEASKWLPGPVRHGALLPLSDDKIISLYEMKQTIQDEDQMICMWDLNESQLIKPDVFKALVQDEKKYKSQEKPEWLRYFKKGQSTYDKEAVSQLLAEMLLATESIKCDEKWCVEALEAGKDDKAREKWQSLLSDVKEVYQLSMTYADEILAHQPEIIGLDDKIKPLDVYSQINQKLQSAGKLSKMTLLLNPQMKTVIQSSRINGRCPETMAEFETLIHYTVLGEKRGALKLRWERQMVPLGAKKVEEMGEDFEVGCQKYCEKIGIYLDWYKKKWQPIVNQLNHYGIDIKSLMELQDFSLEEGSEINYIKETLVSKVTQLLQYELAKMDKDLIMKEKSNLEKAITQYSSYTKSKALTGLKMAIKTNDSTQYEMYYGQIVEAKKKQELIKERADLLDKLAFAAPGWAEFLAKPWDEEEVVSIPEKIEEAWLCRQFIEMIDKRQERTATLVKEEMGEVEKRLQHYTVHLTHDKAWLHKLVDFDANRSEVQAIEGWKQIMAKIGAGKGKQAEMLKAEARKLMPKCQKAVPVWIMPLNKVADHFDPRENKFDVVIIDEASQADMMALVAIYLGKQILIVGDHEQVSPLAIGERVEDMDRLVKTYLEDIPHNYLYSGRFSIYDLAQLSGYQPVRLREHFRCVPEIIGYSNQIAYNGQIEPLREGKSKMLQPAIQTVYVANAIEKNQVNEKEAKAIVDKIIACCKDKNYDGKTFGIISLKGDKQANFIDQILQKEMSTTAYEKRQILCGNPSHFQGDERDIIFISLVDTASESGMMRLVSYGTDNLYKKRYNVAMSRGRDQVFIMHSFDPYTQLKEEDIRKELFTYCKDIYRESNVVDKLYEAPLAEFDAHIKVLLESNGYKVTAHTPSGEPLTGLIVEKNGCKVRLVCDSEKWQEEMELDEEISKQAVLQRIGWQFMYLSATAFYKDEAVQIKKLLEELEKRGL